MQTVLLTVGISAATILTAYVVIETYFACKTRWMRRLTKLANQPREDQ